MSAYAIDNPALVQAIIDALEQGATLRDAAEMAGVGYSTLAKWREQGKKGVQPYADILRRQDAAIATWRMSMVKVVNKAAHSVDYRAAQWLLEKRAWQEYDQRAVIGHLTAKAARDGNLGDAKDEELVDRLLKFVRIHSASSPEFRARVVAALEGRDSNELEAHEDDG